MDNTYIPIKSDYDKIDVDNNFMIIHSGNLNSYLKRFGCDNKVDLEDFFWINYGLIIKII